MRRQLTETLQVREEILAAGHPPAFERGLLRGLLDASLAALGDGTPAVAVSAARTARALHRIAADQLGLDAVVAVRQGGARARRFLLAFPGGAQALGELAAPSPRRLGRHGRRGYLAGLFIACGTLTPPHVDYLLELRVDRPSTALAAEALWQGFGLTVHRRLRREHSVLYLRGADQVAQALSVLGADEARLRLEDARSMRDMRGSVNRLVNAESANVEKSVRAAIAHAEWIRRFAARHGLESLPPKLRDAARARLEDPEAPLEEIGRRLGLTKAGMHYRLRRIAELGAAQLPRPQGDGEDGT